LSVSVLRGKTMENPTLLSVARERLLFANRERWFRAAVQGKGAPPKPGFFDAYPRFFSTSETAAERDRLNQRYRAMIESNADVIAGRRAIDIASHDGRWSFAASKAGAQYMLGLEARQHLVDAARENMREYGIATGSVEFRQADVMVELDRLEPGRFQTVFCFGFLYHTIDHMELFRKIARLKPSSLIIDTAISTHPGCLIEVDEEGVEHESAGAIGEPGDLKHTVIGRPTKCALELMLKAAGFRPIRYYNWRNAGIKRWDDLKDYYLESRITLTAGAVNA
jgi:ubiquinone/menaquinone biosynthesis C-methylase UbiE